MALAAVAVGVTLAGAEGGLRLFVPPRGGFVSLSSPGAGERFELDEELGFVPAFGTGGYAADGLLRGSGSRCGDTCRRVLVLGDSVVHRGRIRAALAELYGDHYRFVGAGVEAYGISQVVGYYRRFGAQLGAEQVLLALHPNDFRRVPAVLRVEGRVALIVDGEPVRWLSPRLFRWSLLYRLVAISYARRGGPLALEDRVRSQLAELDEQVRSAGGRLTVLLLPTFRDPRSFSAAERSVHRRGLELTEELGLRCFDLLDPLAATIARGAPVQEREGDPWHPSREVAEEIARYLLAQGLLPDPGTQPSG